ncbi:ATP-dependent DNA helicase hus2/rqh1, partial [Durusdinium trenchii]
FGLVISPLIALMEDQVRSLRRRGVPAVALHSELSATERRDILATIVPSHRPSELKGFFMKAKTPKLVYLSPELATSSNFAESLRLWSSHIALVAIDEAHCVSKWGHDFRPCYRSLHQVRNQLPASIPWAACTATATSKVRQDVAENLGLKGDPLREVLLPFDRQNLRYGVIHRREDRDFGGTYTELIDLTTAQPPESCGIIYCQRKSDCENIAELLQERGVSAMPFHAGLCKNKKRAAFEAFIGKPLEKSSRNPKGAKHPKSVKDSAEKALQPFPTERARVLVATIAFGMGVDKADVRFVFHAAPPKSLSAYYQESGRAGRDGEPALCVMFFTERDFSGAKQLIISSRGHSATTDIALQELDAVEAFCSNTEECRRSLLLRHFGDPSADKPPATQRLPSHCCDRCAAFAHVSLQGLLPPHSGGMTATASRRERVRPADLPGFQVASKAFGTGGSLQGPAFMTARQLRGDLLHNDKLFLGRVSAVRLIVPEAARSLGQAGSALPDREQDAELLRSVIPEDSRAWADLQLRLEDIRSRLGEESGQEVFQTLLEASNLVDEANEITAAVREEEKLKFEVELVWDIHRAGAATDTVVIRLMKAKEDEHDEEKSPSSQTSEAEHVAVTYWTLLKFKARLDQMRDCFDEKQRHGRWSGSGDCLRDPWMEPSIVELRQRLIAHVDAESKRRNASKVTIPSVPLSPREKEKMMMSKTVKALQGASPGVRFGSKASIVSAESPKTPNLQASRELNKARPQQTLGRRFAPKGIEVTTAVPKKVPRVPSTSSTATIPTVQAEERKVARPPPEMQNGVTKAPKLLQEKGVTISHQVQYQVNGAFKEELSESLKAQLREKNEKEELYRLRIEYLQHQIDLYQTAGAVERSPRVCARARSSSPSHEPRTSEVEGVEGSQLSAAATSFFAPRNGNTAVRSMSAREAGARPFWGATPGSQEVKEPFALRGLISPRAVAEPVGPPVVQLREPWTHSPERDGRDPHPQLRPLASAISPAVVGHAHNVQPIYTVAPPVVVLRPKEPLAVRTSPMRAVLPESRADSTGLTVLT